METVGPVPRAVNCHACQQAVDLTGQEGFSHIQCPHCHAAMVVPVEFGGFTLLSAMGIGGMGTVYRALDMALHRPVALKILKPTLAADPEFIESFSREARAAAAVNHINVAQVYSFGQQAGHYYIAMELLEKGSLDERITQQTRLNEKDVLEIGIQIAAGLRAAYQRGLLHRDVKPGNILFNDEGVPKIVDFGLARARDARTEPGSGQPIWGTPYYIAPEKLLGHADDVRGDIYSLGASLFHAIAGRPPFEAATATDVAAKHTTQPVISLKTFDPSIQEQTAQVIGRMLAKNPAERYASYDEVITDLQNALAAYLAFHSKSGLVTETGERISYATLLGTIGAVAVTIIVVAVLWFNRHHIFRTTTPLPPANTITIPPVTPPPPPAETEISFNPDQPWGEPWQRAANAAAQGRLEQAQQQYDAIRPALTNQPNHRPWLDLYAGLVWLAADRKTEADTHLARATNDLVQIETPAAVTPATLVSPLAAALLGVTSREEIERAAPSMPAWAEAVTRFTVGLLHLRDHDLAGAAAHLHTYERATPSAERQWLFALQPLAAQLAADCDAALQAINHSARQQQAGQLTTAIATINTALSSARHAAVQAKLRDQAALLQQALDDQRRLAQQAADEKEAAEKRAREEKEKQQADADAEVLRALDTALAPRWRAYDYTGILAQYTAAAPRLGGPAARQRLDELTATVRLLIEFKKTLSDDFARQPYSRGDITGIPSGGKISRATDKDLTITLPYGETKCAWSELKPRALYTLALSYAGADPRRKDLLTAFARQYGLAP